MPVENNTVEIRSLSVKFGDFTAVDDISFDIAKGDIFGFLGANGAGKTTTIRVLCGLLVPSAGNVKVAGIELVRRHLGIIKQKVGYMSQKFTLYNDMTVRENLDFKAALRKMDNKKARSESARLLDFIGYRDSPDVMVKNLPAGTKQQVSLAASIIHDPELVFLDEPTSGVSPAVRALFWDLIRELARKGKTIIVTTHYMDEAGQCEHIALIRQGRIIALSNPSDLKKDTYPEPLVEISLSGKDQRSRVEELLKENREVIKYWPHGMKLHAVLKDTGAYSRFAGEFSGSLSIEKIEPSLEDVFIRLVAPEKW